MPASGGGMTDPTPSPKPAPACLLVRMAIGSAYKPLLRILFMPIITVPATLWLTPPGSPLGVCRNVERDLIGGSAFCPTGSLLLALSPGLLDLVPILWLSSR